jgi:hypothetical protein
MSQTIVQRDVLHHGMEQTQQCCNFLCLMCDFCSYVWIGLSLDTNASVIIGSLKPVEM